MAFYPVTVFGVTSDRTLEPVDAVIEFYPDELSLAIPDNASHKIPYNRFSAGLGGIEENQIILETSDGPARLRIYLDAAAETALREISPAATVPLTSTIDALRNTRLHSQWSARWRLIGRVAAAIPAAFILCWVFIEVLAALFPVKWEQKFTDLVFYGSSEAGGDIFVSDPEIAFSVKTLGEQLLSGVRDNPYRFYFKIKHDDAVNAGAFPGGGVLINSGFILSAESPEELAGVMAHEIQHVLRRHAIHQQLYAYFIQTVRKGLFGRGSGLARSAAGNLIFLNYSRSDEQEADLLGMELLTRAGLSGKGMVRFFEKQAAKEDNSTRMFWFISTHPTDQKRLKKLRAAFKRQPPPTRQPDIDWKKFRKRVADIYPPGSGRRKN